MTGVAFPLYNDVEYSYQKLFHPTSISPFPFYVMVDPNGTIRSISHTLSVNEMIMSIQTLLADTPVTEEGVCPVQEDEHSSSCEPDCHERNCGDDGCGGVCGLCPDAYLCEGGWCEPRQATPDMTQSFFDCYIQCGPDQDCALACTEGHGEEITSLAHQLKSVFSQKMDANCQKHN